MTAPTECWYDAPKGNVHAEVWRYVRLIETEQDETYNRLALLESLYDPYSPLGDDPGSAPAKLVNVTENVIASNVDTTYASVATAEVRSRFLTDGADWSTQRRAKKTEYYVEGLGKQLGRHKKCRLAFKECGKKGAGLVKVYATRWREPALDHVRLEDIYVPNEDTRSGAPPMQLHHIQRNYDRDQLKAEYPEAADEIEQLYGSVSPSTRGNESSSILSRRKIVVIESIRLPIGKRPAKKREVKKKKRKAAKKLAEAKATGTGPKYIPGRRTITIEQRTLVDEEYHKPHYPFAMISWSDRQGSFYPISGTERIAGIQRALNKRNWQIDRILDQSAIVTQYVGPGDGNIAAKTTKIGNIVVLKGTPPQAPVLPAVHPETYKSRIELKEAAFEEFGQSRLAAQSKIPAGLETGAAVREYRDSATQRFSPQESDFEQLCLDVDFLLIDVCKDLGNDAPVVLQSRWKRPIAWGDVDLGEVKIQIQAASTLPRTAAGREQTLLEWAQAGIISTDSVKKLSGQPDLERELSLYTSSLEVIDMELEGILEGGTSIPEPYDNLALAVWRAKGTYNNSRQAGAPEDVLEGLRDYISTGAYFISQQNVDQGGGAPSQAALQDPMSAQPTAALSTQAMQLRPTAAP